MNKKNRLFRSFVISLVTMVVTFGASLILQGVVHITDQITTLYIFAVFLISLLTDGYVFGIASAIISTIAVNYAFTFPFFALNYSIPENILSSIIMVSISIITCTLTTKIKQQESIKAESEKERMRANLLRAVSHDLRTPLTTIYGSSSAIIENNQTFTDEQKLKMLNGIKEDSQWLIGMVENLLSVTRIDSGNVKLIKTPTVLEELIDSVLIAFKKRYPNQDVDLDLPDDIVIIPMDAMLIQQVIINILENAVQHAEGMTKLSFKVFALSEKVIFEISDNGCGIPNDRISNLFSGYYESKSHSPDSHTRNAGIGLSVCYSIIKAHGGILTAQNRKSGGAVFRFILNAED